MAITRNPSAKRKPQVQIKEIQETALLVPQTNPNEKYLEEKFEHIITKINILDSKFGNVDTRIDNVNKRLNNVETILAKIVTIAETILKSGKVTAWVIGTVVAIVGILVKFA